MNKNILRRLACLLLALMLLTGGASAMRITQNIMSLNTHRDLMNRYSYSALTKNLEKLSGSYRINRAGDDAEGLALSELMRAQFAGLAAAQESARDGVSLVQTAEGALTEVHSILNRMAEAAELSADGDYSATTTQVMKKDMEALQQEIQQMAEETESAISELLSGLFSGVVDETTMVSGFAYGTRVMVLFTNRTENGFAFSQLATDGSNAIIGSDNPSAILMLPNGDIATVGEGWAFIGAFDGTGKPIGGWELYTDGEYLYAEPGTQLEITLEGESITTLTLNVGETAQLSVQEVQQSVNGTDMQGSLAKVRDMIAETSTYHADIGAQRNRLEHKINNLDTQAENITNVEPRIRDVDMALEMMAYTKNNILILASQSMLAQANMVPHGVLELLE